MKKLLTLYKFQIGFTLIELLIVVSIMVILLGIGAAAYTTVARNSRDTQRKADLKKIQLALEQFKATTGSFPDEVWDGGDTTFDRLACNTDGSVTDGGSGAGIEPGEAFTCGSVTYLGSMPGDPSTGFGYYYEVANGYCNLVDGGNCRHYTLWAHLENPGGTTLDQTCQNALYWNLDEYHYGGNYCVHD